MEPMEGTSENSGQTKLAQSALIPGLPDDFAAHCLARFPRKYHALFNCVSKRWGELVSSEEWHCYRRNNNLDETWIYALCRDESKELCCYVLDPTLLYRGWKRISELPSSTLKRKGLGFEVLGKKIYLLGGCGWVEDGTDEVYCYDASLNSWSPSAPLSTARCYFANEVLGKKIYVIGGLGSNSNDPHSWDTYDPLSNRWMSYADSNVIPDVQDSVVFDGKIYIRCGPVSSSAHAVVYDPTVGTWAHADTALAAGWLGPAVVVGGTLYVLDQSNGGTILMKWSNETRNWTAIMRFSKAITMPPCQLVAIGTRIFVVGKGLSSVVFDLRNVGKIKGMIVTSSIRKVRAQHEVISCKTMAI